MQLSAPAAGAYHDRIDLTLGLDGKAQTVTGAGLQMPLLYALRSGPGRCGHCINSMIMQAKSLACAYRHRAGEPAKQALAHNPHPACGAVFWCWRVSAGVARKAYAAELPARCSRRKLRYVARMCGAGVAQKREPRHAGATGCHRRNYPICFRSDRGDPAGT